jgi:hypothetical protein
MSKKISIDTYLLMQATVFAGYVANPDTNRDKVTFEDIKANVDFFLEKNGVEVDNEQSQS